jgi:hypothetical protein
VREKWLKATNSSSSGSSDSGSGSQTDDQDYDPMATGPIAQSTATSQYAIPHTCPHTAPAYTPDPRDRGQPVAAQPGTVFHYVVPLYVDLL